MENDKKKKHSVVKDTGIYMIAKGTEAVVGILTMSIMTYLFASEQMGQYSTINIAITTVGLVTVQWLTQSVLRYVNKYELAGRQDEFYATVFSSWLKVNVIVVIISLLFIGLLKMFLESLELSEFAWIEESIVTLLIGVMWLVAYNMSQLVVSVVAAMRRATLNMVLSVITVTGKIGLIVLFCVLWESKVEWIFLSYFIVDLAVSAIGIIKLRLYKNINFKKKSKEIYVELKNYGTPLMGNMVANSVLNKSDIYIVTGFWGRSAAGIYQTNYSLVATAFTMVSSAVMRGHYPTILRVWSEGRKDDANNLVSAAARFYLLLAIPGVVGVGMISDVIAKALYAPEYFSGNGVMFWVALGMMVLGLTEYNIKPWEMNAKTNAIFYRSMIGGTINVILNIVLVPIFGYKVAAVTTFIGFLVYFILARVGTRKYEQWKLPLFTYVRIMSSALVMAVVLYFMKKVMTFNIISLAIMVITGAIVYGITLILTGEVKNEVMVLKEMIQRRIAR